MAQGVLGRAARSSCAVSSSVADLRAVGVARRGGGDEPAAGALDQLARRGGRDLQRLGDLVVAEPVELAHQQRRALLLGQVGEVLDQLAAARAGG